MALQTIANKMGLLIESTTSVMSAGASGGIMDAAGESNTYIGKVFLEGATGSKVISGAGAGKIRWRTGSVTFADAGTNVRVGIQDVGVDGKEDGTFDVYADLVGGTDTISASANQLTTMETGTKTITHGDTIAVSIEMTAKGGSDTVTVTGFITSFGVNNHNSNFPYKTFDSGSGPSKSGNGIIGCTIEFDDGTLGWIEPVALIQGWTSSPPTKTVNTGTTPDEIAAVFQVPFECRISGGYMYVGSIASTDNFEIVLYSDPLGTPVVEQTVTVDPDFTGGMVTALPYYVTFTAETLSPNTWYALAVRPTTANSITVGYLDFETGNDDYKKVLPFGTNVKLAGRSDQTGAFVETQVYEFPLFGIMIDQLDDGVDSGGGSGGFFIQ